MKRKVESMVCLKQEERKIEVLRTDIGLSKKTQNLVSKLL